MPPPAAVVACGDDGRALDRTLATLALRSVEPGRIVVVDGGSTDPYTLARLGSLGRGGVRVARLPGGGWGARWNEGVRLLDAPCVVLLRAGDLPEAGPLDRAADALLSGRDAAVVSAAGDPVAIGTPSPRPPADLAAALAHGPRRIGLVLRREAWETLGGLVEDPALAGYEAVDLLVSALERGIGVLPSDEPILSAAPPVPPAAGAGRRFLERHRRTADSLGLPLLVEKMATVASERRRLRRLLREAERLESALREGEAAVGDLVRAAAARGVPTIEWGDLRRTAPFSDRWGLDRGMPVDRYYIDRFLDRHRADVRGAVLEVKDPAYTDRFGGGRVTRRDVLDRNPANPAATIRADLAVGDGIPSDRYDCFILTQTLHINYDVRAALAHARRLLKPGGVLLCTFQCVSRTNDEDGGLDGGDHWRFTEASARRLLAEVFPIGSVEVTPYGNLLACAAFLRGLAREEVSPHELGEADPWHPLVLGARAVKSGGAAPAPPRAARPPAGAGAILAYHRIAEAEAGDDGLAVSPEAFHAQVRALADRFRPVPLADLARAAAEGAVQDGAVAVTIDDGTIDALTVASPALLEAGVPATFFVTAADLGREEEHWWDLLERVFGRSRLPPRLEIEIEGLFLRLPAGTREERLAARRAVRDRLIPAPLDVRREAIARLLAWSGDDGRRRPGRRRLVGTEIRTLAGRAGHAIGSHTLHHLDLPSRDLGTRHREIIGARRALEDLLGRPVSSFAYPYGRFDEATKEAVRAAGHPLAVTARPGAVRAGADPLALPRLEIREPSVEALLGRLREAMRVER